MLGKEKEMMMVMVVMMVMIVRALLVIPGAPDHPGGYTNNNHGRCQLKIGFGLARVPVLAKVQASHGHSPHPGGVRQGSRQA